MSEQPQAEPAKTGSFAECLKAVYDAGGKAWDKVENPNAYIRWMRGDDDPEAVAAAEQVERAERAELRARAEAAEAKAQPFQSRVHPWMIACFGERISKDRTERCHRFLEESLEVVQSIGCTKSEAHQLVDYVFGRPAGEQSQEIGGAMVTLAALSLAVGEDMHTCGETELGRIWTKVEQIRAKQAAKPSHSPLPAKAALETK